MPALVFGRGAENRTQTKRSQSVYTTTIRHPDMIYSNVKNPYCQRQEFMIIYEYENALVVQRTEHRFSKPRIEVRFLSRAHYGDRGVAATQLSVAESSRVQFPSIPH